MEKSFEVPYNFDFALLSYYRKHASKIKFIYVPPYKDDSINTRSSIETLVKGHCYMPVTRSEYESHLERIVDSGLSFVILWQLPQNNIAPETILYYRNLGAIGFIVASDNNALTIKNFDSSLLVIGSLVQRLGPHILSKKIDNYDYILLYYTFNRSLDALKKLHSIKDKIVLMPNTLCNIECPSMHHWFPSKEYPFIAERDCWVHSDKMDKCGFIFPEDLHLFDHYVAGYKLQGREYPTEAIKYICHFYFSREYYENFVDQFLREDMIEKLKEIKIRLTPEQYYNSYTEHLINRIN